MSVASPLPDFAPLDKALKQIQSRLESDEAPRILVAALTAREFKQQKLPPHCKVTRRKIHGPRVPVRGHRHADQARLVLAHWPQDGLLEGALPSLFCVLSGQADIRIADYVVHCRVGDMIFIPPGIPKLDSSCPHYETVSAEAHCDLLMLTPGLAYGQGLECSICHSRGDKHMRGDEDEGCWVRNLLISQLFAGLANELQNEGDTGRTFHLLSYLIFVLRRHLERKQAFKSWHFPRDSSQSHNLDSIRLAVEYMRSHLDKPLSIDIVARQIGSSRTAFTRRFRKDTGQTFKAHLTQLRLEHAELLLCEANLPVSRVSSLVGLSSGQLRNLFLQAHACSPSQFRNLQISPKIDS